MQAMARDGFDLVWPLNEDSGTLARDGSGNGRSGTYNLTTGVGATVPALAPGEKQSWAPGFGRHVSRAYDAALSPGTGDWAICFVYRRATTFSGATGNYEVVMNRDYGGSGNGLIIYIRGAGTPGPDNLLLWCAGAARAGGADLVDGTSKFVYLERRTGVVRCYVNGVQDATFGDWAAAGSCNGSGTPMMVVGAYETGSGPTQVQTGAERYYLDSPIQYFGYCVGVIPPVASISEYLTLLRRGGVVY